MARGQVNRPGPGRPKQRPAAVAGDKACSVPHLRRWRRRKQIRAVIPRRRDQSRRGPFDRLTDRQRHHVERTLNHLKQYRRLATRYEKLTVTYLTLWVIASFFLWL